jgi:hypothetical protein
MPTIRRRREQLVAAGAVVDPKGWRIPHSALVAAGFDPSWTTEQPQEPHSEPGEAEPIPTPTEELRVTQDRVRRLESENTVLRSQVEHWQLIARERLDALNDQRVAFRALVMTRPPEIEAKPEPAERPAGESKRGLWHKLIHG